MERSGCSVCHKSDATMKWCSVCRGVKYCSLDCQKKDWPIHKKSCDADSYDTNYELRSTFKKIYQNANIMTVIKMLSISAHNQGHKMMLARISRPLNDPSETNSLKEYHIINCMGIDEDEVDVERVPGLKSKLAKSDIICLMSVVGYDNNIELLSVELTDIDIKDKNHFISKKKFTFAEICVELRFITILPLVGEPEMIMIK